MKSLDRLVALGSTAISRAEPQLTWASELGVANSLVTELDELLRKRNGFFAFESALLVLPSTSDGGVVGLDEWNHEGWIRGFDRLPNPTLFFAQDVFAGQYGLTTSGVIGSEPETGEVTLYGPSLEEWAETVLRDYDVETGWSVAHEWQLKHGPLRAGDRLLPKKPFVLGGEYTADNLVAVEASQAMHKLATLYRQIRDVPDGTTLTVKDWL